MQPVASHPAGSKGTSEIPTHIRDNCYQTFRKGLPLIAIEVDSSNELSVTLAIQGQLPQNCVQWLFTQPMNITFS